MTCPRFLTRTFGPYPFGELWYETGAASKWKFTSYERDSESGLDYAMHRYDSSRIGRFTSPDPLAGSIAIPQSLNRYAYVNNDPVNLVDPSGLDCIRVYNEDNDAEWDCTGTTVDVTDTAPEVDIITASMSSDNFFDRTAEFGGISRSWFYSGVRRLQRFARTRLSLVAEGKLTDCQALLQIFGSAFSLFDSPSDAVDALATVLTDRNSLGITRLDTTDSVGVFRPGAVFGSTGFAQDFADSSNQVRHFTVFFSVGFNYGRGVASAAAYSGGAPFGAHDTPKDVHLGVVGGNLGQQLFESGKPDPVLQKVGEQICDKK